MKLLLVELTIEITQYCEEDCDYCSSNASMEGTDLSFEDIKKIVENITAPIERINISGGEPLSHPEFYAILTYCEDIVPDRVWVYTNALKNIVYNTDVIREINIEANVCITPGYKYIPKNANTVRLLKLVYQGRAKDLLPCNITVSRNFWDEGACDSCDHILIQANGEIRTAPCKKDYPTE